MKKIYNLYLGWEGKRSISCQIIGLTKFFLPEMTHSLGVMKTQPLCFFPVLREETFHSPQFMNFKTMNLPSHSRGTQTFSCQKTVLSINVQVLAMVTGRGLFKLHFCYELAGGSRTRTANRVWTYAWAQRAGTEFTNHQLP